MVVIAGANGGAAGIAAMIEPERLGLFSLDDRSVLELVEAWAVPVFGSLLAVEMLSRIQGCRSAEVARNATFLGAGLYLGVGLIPVALGLAGPTLVPNLDDPEQVVPILAQRYLSTFGYVLFAGAVISAILSTVGSCLLAAASLASHNLIVPLRPSWSESKKVWSARLGVIGFGALAYAIALYAGGIYELVATASAFGSAGIFVIGVFGLFTSFGGARSAYAALVAGMVVWVAGEYVLDWATPYVVSLGSALAAYVTAALLARRETLPRAGAVAPHQ
jgi:Na+/proline symporter